MCAGRVVTWAKQAFNVLIAAIVSHQILCVFTPGTQLKEMTVKNGLKLRESRHLRHPGFYEKESKRAGACEGEKGCGGVGGQARAALLRVARRKFGQLSQLVFFILRGSRSWALGRHLSSVKQKNSEPFVRRADANSRHPV